MKAKVIKSFRGAPDGEVHPKQFKPGDTVEGDLACVAIREGWAEDNRTPKKSVSETGGSASQAGRVSRKRTSKKSKGKGKLRLSTTATD